MTDADEPTIEDVEDDDEGLKPGDIIEDAEFLDAGDKVVLATHNAGKIRELSDFLEWYKISAVSAVELKLPEPEETGGTFFENAQLKAEAAMKATNMPALADDSGLEIDALDGQPGVHSARWAGEPRDFSVAMQRVHDELVASGIPQPWRARFSCNLALAWPSEVTCLFWGSVTGTCVWPPRGENGFGYDPIFVPDGYDMTFGEMKPADKERISHRRAAFEHFAESMILEAIPWESELDQGTLK